MKVIIASVLIFAAAVTCEPPTFGSARQSAPYNPRGWRPEGPSFELPQQQRAAPQTAYGAPQNVYGPPQQSQRQLEPQTYIPPEVETTTAAEEVTTMLPAKLVENIEVKKVEKLEKEKEKNPVFLVIPQPEKLVYAIQQSAPLVTLPQAKVLGNLETIPLAQTAYVNSYYTPTFTSSYFQIYK